MDQYFPNYAATNNSVIRASTASFHLPCTSLIARIVIHLCRQLKTTVNLTLDFAHDVSDLCMDRNSLLNELKNKVQKLLINLDEEMGTSEKLIRYNIDKARINDDRVAWLLKFNDFHLEMKRMLNILSDTIFSDLERVLTLQFRGCLGLTLKTDTMEHLRQMKLGMDRAENLIALETQMNSMSRSKKSS